MSRFLSEKYKDLEPYTPGEQFREEGWIKLNTNESPFSPPDEVVSMAAEAGKKLQLYSDPDCTDLRRELAGYLGVKAEQLLLTNGSDEILHFAFMAFCDQEHPALFPDITYGFYKVFAQLDKVPYRQIPLKEDLTVDISDYTSGEGTVFLANPNANTGIALSPEDIEEILKANRNRVVVIDEAYVEFGAKSVLPLIEKYDNLLVTRTFSKAWSMAGARLGFGIGSSEIIDDLNRIKYSTDPYNVNSMTQAATIGAVRSSEEIRANCMEITRCRERLMKELKEKGFDMTPSEANFVFAKHPKIKGKDLYERLKEKKILVRHFDKDRISDYIRITVGSDDQIGSLLNAIDEILEVVG